ncbi:MAG: glycoside hydrolase family 2 TIM barrel-domain containing protein, partial [Lachnospiraceae bacterium]
QHLLITVDNRMQPNARWYSGSGLYRHAKLLTADPVFLRPWGIFLHTDHVVGENAFLTAEVTVENRLDHPVEVWAEISLRRDLTPEDHAGTGRPVVLDPEVAGFGRCKLHIPAGQTACGRAAVTVRGAKLWDLAAPNLYRACVRLLDALPDEQGNASEDSVLDTDESTLFGIRTITVDDVNGLLLNGKSVKCKGGCLHHDNGILGAASFYDSEYRRLKLLRDNGFNAVRFSHNPMSAEELETCDRLGLLVIDEIFDVWRMGKCALDYSAFFEEDWNRAMTETALRDRNHPCVFAWSVGNEITERGRISEGWKTAAALSDRMRELDPTRPIMGSLPSFFSGLSDQDRDAFWQSMREEVAKGKSLINVDNAFGRKIWSDYTEDFSAKFDIVGYNYLQYHYEEAPVRFPHRVIIGTESKPLEFGQYWKKTMRLPYVIGDFTWTAMDYLGETGIGQVLHCKKEEAKKAAQQLHFHSYPSRTTGAGDFDLCGFPRTRLAYRRIVWGSEETFLATQNPAFSDLVELTGSYGWPDFVHAYTWPGEENKAMKALVYSAAPEVELFQNGKSLGVQPAGEAHNWTAAFSLCYEPGELRAVSLRNGRAVSEDVLATAGPAAGIRILPDRTELVSDGQSLLFAVVELVDGSGRLVPTAEEQLEAQAEGCAFLSAFGSGRMVTRENYTAGTGVTLNGRILAVLRSSRELGEGTLTVTCPRLGLREVLRVTCVSEKGE